MGAYVGCCASKCRRSFHLPCAIEAECTSDFANGYLSFCHKHSETSNRKHQSNEICIICRKQMGEFNHVRSIECPCCEKAWYHKQCLLKTANKEGHSIKCGICNNTGTFQEKIQRSGVFVPLFVSNKRKRDDDGGNDVDMSLNAKRKKVLFGIGK